MAMRSMASTTITHMCVVTYLLQMIVKKVYKSLPNYWVLVIDLPSQWCVHINDKGKILKEVKS